jgi:glycosyltransferase involved in cell wall biosynthesis
MKCPAFNELPYTTNQGVSWAYKEPSTDISFNDRSAIKWPRVSIITPSFNQEKFIEETIRSILLQDYPDLEYIIIDGGSKDGTVDVIRKYQSWISYWVSEKDAGQTAAINKGFKISTGEIIAWQNSDDTYEPGAIMNAVKFMVDHPETGVVYSDCNLVDENSRVISQLPSKKYTVQNCLLQHIVPNQTAFIRRGVWEAVGGVDNELHFAIEEDFWLKIGLISKLDQLPGIWANHRKYIGTKTVSQAPMFYREQLKVLDRFFTQTSLSPEIINIKNQVYANAHLIGAFRLNMDKEKELTEKAFIKAIDLNPELAMNDIGKTVKRIIGWAWIPDVIDPVDFVIRFFDCISNVSPGFEGFKKTAVAEIAIGLFFKVAREGNPRLARSYLTIAIRNDPRWILNRGVLSTAYKIALS